jgi:hypothetical protein
MPHIQTRPAPDLHHSTPAGRIAHIAPKTLTARERMLLGEAGRVPRLGSVMPRTQSNPNRELPR